MNASETTVYEVENAPVEVVEDNTEVLPEDWTEEAQKAYDDIIKKKQLEVREVELESAIAELEAELTETQKELGSF